MWAQSASKSVNETNAYGSLSAVYIPLKISTVLARKKRAAQIGVRRLKLFSSSVCLHLGGTPVMKDYAASPPQRKIKDKPSSPEYMSNLVARLFGPAIFEASKLNVLFLGVDEEKPLPRTYTLTHSDITAHLTLAISQTINKAQLQGWYSRLQRDEVVAEWRKDQGKMSLHVHCHISGGHWLLNVMARLRFSIFHKELPVVLEAFRHGDEALFKSCPELEEALVWVYFHSNVEEYNRVECWGPLVEAANVVKQRKWARKGQEDVLIHVNAAIHR
ncbi:protein STAY-GREEN homolog, chloroplastic [Cryptomeria japonica]|uniref:protein STAY-GREEN homolog, chloroplastic n=1 Tax=Cryptomeria japonica TaxID=3369 RepID=UPI0025ACFA3E|nr:protein STAY-GREEN homolog, chloroplastic [Cryptomeria japonica]